MRNDVGSDGHRWVTLGSAAQPDLEVVLSSVPHAGRSKAGRDTYQELLTKGSLPNIVFRDPSGIMIRFNQAPGD